MTKRICIIGAGGFGREILETLKEINKLRTEYEILGFFDDDPSIENKAINGYPVLGSVEDLLSRQREEGDTLYAVMAIAHTKIKEKIAKKLDGCVIWENIIHPTAVISDTCEMGEGNVFQMFSSAGPNVKVGSHCHVNISSLLGHDAVLDDYVSVMPHCNITGFVRLCSNVYTATAVSVIPGITIGKDAYIGVGSVILKDVEEGAFMLGNPAERKK